MDNLAVATITNRNASSLASLRFLHKGICQLQIKYNIKLWFRWRRRNSDGLILADSLSKVIDMDEWLINPSLLSQLCKSLKCPFPTLDAFANSQNHLSKRYFTLHWDPHAAGTDFFRLWAYPWKKDFAWINPPFNRRLIAMTVDKIISWNITGILCVPAWTRSGWWWLVRRFARKILRVSKSEKLFLPNLRLHRHGPNLPNTTRWDTFICLFTWDSPLPLDSWTSPTSFKPFRANSDYG